MCGNERFRGGDIEGLRSVSAGEKDPDDLIEDLDQALSPDIHLTN
jgi:hypothetical protein